MGEPMPERWLPVPGWERFYEVSDLGRIRSLDRITSDGRHLAARILRGRIDEDGYRRVKLSANRYAKLRSVHQLVAEAFIGPRPPGKMVRHLDGNPANNVLGNLAWGTGSENKQDEIRHGRNVNLNKTHCPRNHEYAPDNTYNYGRGRVCKKCAALAQAIRRAPA